MKAELNLENETVTITMSYLEAIRVASLAQMANVIITNEHEDVPFFNSLAKTIDKAFLDQEGAVMPGVRKLFATEKEAIKK